MDYHHRYICAAEGTTVNISATYWHPDWAIAQEANWLRPHEGHYRDVRSIPENSSRVTESCDSRSCILTIGDLRESDAAQYWLSLVTDRGKYVNTRVPGVTLTVTGETITTSSASQQRHRHNILGIASSTSQYRQRHIISAYSHTAVADCRPPSLDPRQQTSR